MTNAICIQHCLNDNPSTCITRDETQGECDALTSAAVKSTALVEGNCKSHVKAPGLRHRRPKTPIRHDNPDIPPLLRFLAAHAYCQGMTTVELARSLGVTPGYLHQMKSGFRSVSQVGDTFVQSVADTTGLPTLVVQNLAGRLEADHFAELGAYGKEFQQRLAEQTASAMKEAESSVVASARHRFRADGGMRARSHRRSSETAKTKGSIETPSLEALMSQWRSSRSA